MRIKVVLNAKNITRLNCAIDSCTILCLYVTGYQRQAFKHVKISSERPKKKKEQMKDKGSALVAECAYNSQNAHFGFLNENNYLLNPDEFFAFLTMFFKQFGLLNKLY